MIMKKSDIVPGKLYSWTRIDAPAYVRILDLSDDWMLEDGTQQGYPAVFVKQTRSGGFRLPPDPEAIKDVTLEDFKVSAPDRDDVGFALITIKDLRYIKPCGSIAVEQKRRAETIDGVLSRKLSEMDRNAGEVTALVIESYQSRTWELLG